MRRWSTRDMTFAMVDQGYDLRDCSALRLRRNCCNYGANYYRPLESIVIQSNRKLSIYGSKSLKNRQVTLKRSYQNAENLVGKWSQATMGWPQGGVEVMPSQTAGVPGSRSVASAFLNRQLFILAHQHRMVSSSKTRQPLPCALAERPRTALSFRSESDCLLSSHSVGSEGPHE